MDSSICLQAMPRVNVGNIWNLSKIGTEEAFTERKSKKPFWERFYIDIFLLIVGITAWIITYYQLRNTAVSAAFAQVLGAPAPIVLILGVVLFSSRIYPILTNWLSRISWKFEKFELDLYLHLFKLLRPFQG